MIHHVLAAHLQLDFLLLLLRINLHLLHLLLFVFLGLLLLGLSFQGLNLCLQDLCLGSLDLILCSCLCLRFGGGLYLSDGDLVLFFIFFKLFLEIFILLFSERQFGFKLPV